eukprot:946468-Pelagomonas_calceolata.AAC.1
MPKTNFNWQARKVSGREVGWLALVMNCFQTLFEGRTLQHRLLPANYLAEGLITMQTMKRTPFNTNPYPPPCPAETAGLL